MFNTIDEVYNYLFNQKKTAPRENLDRITRAAEMLNIKTDYPIIHVAGTNGKGSVCAYIKSAMMHKNLHIGMFVSPFVISFNERIQINDRYISNSEIMHYANILYDFNNKYEEEYNDHLPFFELTLLMALMYFQDRNIDMAIIECGLGGKLDSTNFLDCDLAIITNIGFDHMAQLGNTLESIADHKLGIAKEGMTCLTAVDPKLHNYFKAYAEKNQVNMVFINDDVTDIKTGLTTSFKYKGEDYKAALSGTYQAYNAALAIEAIHYMDKAFPKTLIEFGLENVFWPGRLEAVSNEPLILIDGAHNMPAIKALSDSVKLLKNGRPVKVIFSALQDKAYPEMIKILEDITDKFYFTKIVDLRQTEPIDFSLYTNKENESINNFKDCMDKAINDLNKDEILLITGSLHFISQAREYYLTKYKK